MPCLLPRLMTPASHAQVKEPCPLKARGRRGVNRLDATERPRAAGRKCAAQDPKVFRVRSMIPLRAECGKSARRAVTGNGATRSEAPALRKPPGTATPIRLPLPRQLPTLLHCYSKAVFPGEIPGRSRLELLGRRRGAGCAFMEWLTAVCNQSQPFLQRCGRVAAGSGDG